MSKVLFPTLWDVSTTGLSGDGLLVRKSRVKAARRAVRYVGTREETGRSEIWVRPLTLFANRLYRFIPYPSVHRWYDVLLTLRMNAARCRSRVSGNA
jgi:hypothetical protein